MPNILRRVSFGVAKPLWSIGNVISSPFSKIKNYFVFKSSLVEENLKLEDELNALKIKELDYDTLSKENESLKAELGRDKSSERVLAAVLSKPPRSPYDTLVLDVGSEDGIAPGSKVYFGENIIVGLVRNITPHTSLVSLFSTSNEKQEAILSRTGASFVLNGKGGENFQFEVPKDTDILWGDVFMYPGLASNVIASVYYIDTNSQSSFKTVYLRIPANVFSAKYFFVGKSQ